MKLSLFWQKLANQDQITLTMNQIIWYDIQGSYQEEIALN